MKKRLLALLTSLALALSVVPSVFAEGETTEDTTTVTTVDGFSEIMATSYSYKRNGNATTQIQNDGDVPYMKMTRYGGMTFQNVDFGEGADAYVLDVRTAGKTQYGDNLTVKATTTAWDTSYTESTGSETYLKSGTLLASLPSQPNGEYYGTWSLRHYVVSNPSALKGVVNLNFYVSRVSGTTAGWDNFRSFQFNKAVNPYEQLLTEAITAEAGKEIKSLYFDGTGAASVDLAYTGTGTLSIYQDTMNGTALGEPITTITLDGTQNFAVDNALYQGATDLYFTVDNDVNLTGIQFNTVKGALEEQAIVDGVTDYLVNFGNGGYNSIIFNSVTLPVADSDGLITVTVGEEELKLPVTKAGTVRLNLNDTLAALNGVQTVKISLLNAAAQSFEFTKVVDGWSKIDAETSYSYYRETPNVAGGSVGFDYYDATAYLNLDFGEVTADDVVILDMAIGGGSICTGKLLVMTAGEKAYVEPATPVKDQDYCNYTTGSTIIEVPAYINGSWSAYDLKHFVVTNPELLNGVINVKMYGQGKFSNVDYFQFNKAVNPYAELLTESITDAKEIKSLYFTGNGASAINLDYTVTDSASDATVAIYKDALGGTNLANLVQTITLDGTGSESIKLDATAYQGATDLYFVVTNAEVSALSFDELKTVDPFDGKETINALYIGDDSDWEADVKAEFEGALEYYEKTYVDTYVDLSKKSDVEYLDFLKNIPTADIVFIQAGAKAKAILDELSKHETKPLVVVIGTADYAADYDVAAVSTGTNAFELVGTYKKPTALTTRPAYEVIKAISYDGNYGAKQEGTYDRVNNFNGTGQYIMFKNVDFTNGIKNVTFNYASNAAAKTGKLEVRVGSKNGTLIATSSACTVTGGWGEPNNKLDTVAAEQSLYGVYDVYVVSNSGPYGNLVSVQFTQDDSIDAKAGLSTSNGVASENLEVLDGTYYAISEADSVEYSDVNFGETERNYYVDVEVAVSADAQGSLYIEENGDTFVKYDLSEAGQNFTKLSVMTNEAVSGLKDLSVRYAGSGTAYLKSITFRDVLSYKDVLGVSNYSIDDTTAILNTNRFEKMDQDDAYVVWKDVDFTGSEDKILTMKAQIGVADGYDGGYLTVRADGKNGPVIARTPVVHQTGMGWTVPEYYLEAPVIADLTGTHDLYVSIDNAPVMEKNKAGNIFSIEFIENIEDTIVTNYWVDMKINEEESKLEKEDMNSAVRFKNADANLKKFVLVTAVYGANGLVDVDYNVCDAVVGVNTALSTVPASALEASYTVKTFLGNAETLMPLNGEAIINENVTAE